MKHLYRLIVTLYWTAIHLAAPFNSKAKQWVRGRKKWLARLQSEINSSERWVWVHCASYGEFEDLSVVLSSLRAKLSDHAFLLTFYSPSGMTAVQNQPVADRICYMPFDFPSNAKSFLDVVQPEFILFSRSELWYYFLSEIRKRGLPCFLVSALIHPKSRFLNGPQKAFYTRCLRTFDFIYCQDKQTTEILSKLGCSAGFYGNSRQDTIYQSLHKRAYSEIAGFRGNQFCVIAGSMEKKDEQLILESISRLKDLPIKWILVPHEFGAKSRRMISQNSEFIAYSDRNKINESHTVMYIDFVGGLKDLYAHADLAIIGGGFQRKGIHNIMEPAFHGVPTTFGPCHRDYPEALKFMGLGFAETHSDACELETIIRKHFHFDDRKQKQEAIRKEALNLTGASENIVKNVLEQLKLNSAD